MQQLLFYFCPTQCCSSSSSFLARAGAGVSYGTSQATISVSLARPAKPAQPPFFGHHLPSPVSVPTLALYSHSYKCYFHKYLPDLPHKEISSEVLMSLDFASDILLQHAQDQMGCLGSRYEFVLFHSTMYRLLIYFSQYVPSLAIDQGYILRVNITRCLPSTSTTGLRQLHITAFFSPLSIPVKTSRLDLPLAKLAHVTHYENYVPKGETICNNYSQRCVKSGEWPQNWVLRAKPERCFKEYIALCSSLSLKPLTGPMHMLLCDHKISL